MFAKIFKTILSILLIPVMWWYLWKGTKIIPFLMALIFPLRILLFIVSMIIFPLGWFFSIWGIWIKN